MPPACARARPPASGRTGRRSARARPVGIPTPGSLTLTPRLSSARPHRDRDRARPSGEYLIALDSRLFSTCSRWSRSADDRRARRRRQAQRRSCARSVVSLHAARRPRATSSHRSTGSQLELELARLDARDVEQLVDQPPQLARSASSSTSSWSTIDRAARAPTPRSSAGRSSSRRRVRRSDTCTKPEIDVSGVFSSCDAIDRNCDFSRSELLQLLDVLAARRGTASRSRRRARASSSMRSLQRGRRLVDPPLQVPVEVRIVSLAVLELGQTRFELQRRVSRRFSMPRATVARSSRRRTA